MDVFYQNNIEMFLRKLLRNLNTVSARYRASSVMLRGLSRAAKWQVTVQYEATILVAVERDNTTV